MKCGKLYIVSILFILSSCAGLTGNRSFLDISSINDTEGLKVLKNELNKYILSPDDLIKNNIVLQNDKFIYEGDILLSEEQAKLICYKNIIVDLFGEKNYSHATYLLIQKNRTWNTRLKHDLSYSFVEEMDLGGLSDAEVRECFKKAASTWMSVADINFYEKKHGGRISIAISYFSNPLPGQQKVNHGHSALPNQNRKGDQIFALNKYYWDQLYNNDTAYIKTQLYQVMLHQIGHTLGLLHYRSKNRIARTGQFLEVSLHDQNDKDSTSSIMDRENPHRGLSNRDITVIQVLYGKPGSGKDHLAKK